MYFHKILLKFIFLRNFSESKSQTELELVSGKWNKYESVFSIKGTKRVGEGVGKKFLEGLKLLSKCETVKISNFKKISVRNFYALQAFYQSARFSIFIKHFHHTYLVKFLTASFKNFNHSVIFFHCWIDYLILFSEIQSL